MEQADAGPGGGSQRGVAVADRWSNVAERLGAIRRRGASKMTAEGPGKHRMAGEPGAGGDAHDRLSVVTRLAAADSSRSLCV